MERYSGRHPDKSTVIVGHYDYLTRIFTNVNYYTDTVFCAAHTVTQDGHVLVVGGHIAGRLYGDGLRGVRIFSRKTLNMTRIGNLTYPRWYPTATLLPNGMVTIMGGTTKPSGASPKNPIYEIWDPASPTQQQLFRNQTDDMFRKTKYIYYPNTYVLPTGDLFMVLKAYGEITNPMTGVRRTILPSWANTAPRNVGGMVMEYPYTGTSVMLALTPENGYTPEVVVFGGQFPGASINTTASRLSLRIKVLYNETTGNYTFGEGWIAEFMPLPRVMGDAVILPNGHVVVLNGAMKGSAGDGTTVNKVRVNQANEPNLWPVLYDPGAPYGSRMRLMARSRIARLYHSTALLTPDGSVLVAGCDRAELFWSSLNDTEISRSPQKAAEYRIEMFRPPYWFNQTAKPQIVSISNATWDPEDAVNVMQYGAPFELQYSLSNATHAVTSAVLVSPGSVTHSTNMNQRVVGLEIVSQDLGARCLVLKGPPNINIAPPGWYMLFLLNGNVYGTSVWVRLPGNAPRLDYLVPSS
ncbi:hypothetical protein PLESTF_000317200 [Pleodorina starrii]|nr:hypothetical protein PLESTF_000317200 [Pleodorina starrii]